MRRAVIFPMFASALLAVLSRAESPTRTPEPAPTVPPAEAQVTVTLVQVEVRVEDKKGRFIPGLAIGDFQLFEDGVEQKLEYVDEVAVAATPARPAASPLPSVTPAVPPERRSGPDRATLVLVVDRANSSGEAIRRQRKYLDGLLSSLDGRENLVAVIEIKPNGGYEILHNFSTDLAAARRAVERLGQGGAGSDDRRGKSDLMESILEQKIGQCARGGGPDSSCQESAFRGLIHTAKTFAGEERARAVVALDSLTAIVRFTDHLPGSRSLILISEGIDPNGVSYLNTAAQLIRFYSQNVDRIGDTQRYISELQREAGTFGGETPRLQEITRLAQAANLTVHWVNPSSGHERALSAEQQLGGYATGGVEIAQAADPPRLMQGMAEDTGGLALPRATGLADFFTRLSRDLNTYYVLSYTPGRQYRDGVAHKIEVKTRQSGSRVRAHKSYIDQLPQERLQRTLAAALDFPDLFATFPISASLGYLRKGPNYHLQVRLALPYEEISLSPRGGRGQGTLHFGWAVRDPRGELVKSGAPRLVVDESDEAIARLVAARARLDYGFGLDLAPGKYSLVAAVLDPADLQTATRRFDLDLPGAESRCLAVTPLLLAQEVTTLPDRVAELSFEESGQARWQDLRLSFSALPTFPPSGKLTGVYQVLNVAAAPEGTSDVVIFFRLFQGKSFINQTPSTTLARIGDPAARSISSVFSVPYSRLAPGDYRLELAAHDNRSGCEALGSAAFTIAASVSATPPTGAPSAGTGRKE